MILFHDEQYYLLAFNKKCSVAYIILQEGRIIVNIEPCPIPLSAVILP